MGDFQYQYDVYWRKAHAHAYETRRVTRHNVLCICDGLKDCVDLYEVEAIMNRVIKVWRDGDLCWGEFKRAVIEKLSAMVDFISNSGYMMINFDDPEDVALSRRVLDLFREVLGEDLEIEFAMDCSRDEEIALALARAEEDLVAFPAPF